MKRNLLLVLMTLLPMVMLTTFTSCSKDDGVIELDKDNPDNDNDNGDNDNGDNNNGDNDNGDNDNGDNDNGDSQQNQEIIVTVDANGNADGGHRFTKINDSNFYIDDIKYTAVSGNLEVTGYNKAFFAGVAKIISKLNYDGRTLKVTAIAEKAFYECSGLTSITIPGSVTSIGGSAFYGCSGLTKVIVPDLASWCSIVYDGNSGGDFPMYYAKHLYSDDNTEITEVVVPEGVTRIESLAFRDAKYITSITIPKSVTYIGREAFRGMHSITSIVFPQDITSIEPYTCQDCEALTSVDIPEGVTNIGDNAFAKCYDMKDFYCYAENVPTTGSNVFKSSSIASATLHVPAASIGAYKATEPWKNFGRIVAIE